MTQPPEPSPPPSRGGLIREGVDRAIAFAEGGPWKAAAVIVLLVLCFIGWVLYERRTDIIEAWLTPSALQLKSTDTIVEMLEWLVKDIDVDLVQVWRIDVSRTGQDFVAARRKDGERPVIPEPRHLPIMDQQSDPKFVASTLAGYPACLTLKLSGGSLERRMAERGFERGCAVQIPAVGRAYVGLMYLIWEKARDESAENVAKEAARTVADKMATH